jgi:uncharacterized protein YdhG (YjbR/CyaY superfamily)/quercetin dioxygenase-like cupin family protein
MRLTNRCTQRLHCAMHNVDLT